MNFLTTVDAYHQRSKHRFDRYAAALGYLDWANQPHPFRYYEGTSSTRLELNRKLPPIEYDQIYRPEPLPPAPLNLETLSDFFFYSLALSAWKQAGEKSWALRVNPSSGNLHPTEAYLLLSALSPDATPSLYHYVSESHALELRATFPHEVWQEVMGHQPRTFFIVGLSSIIWREAWKYGERAFRYCQHDIGHAIAALRISAALCGWQLTLVPTWSTEDVASLLGLDRQQDFVPEEHEEPEVLALITTTTDGTPSPSLSSPSKELIHKIQSADWHGRANRLSREHVPWPVIDEVTLATRKPREAALAIPSQHLSEWPPASLPRTNCDARQIIYHRRSCLALDGSSRTSRDNFLRILGSTLPGAHPPWDALYWPPMIHLVLFVHRVDDVAPGIYALVRDPTKIDALRNAMHNTFVWKTPPGVPEDFPLYLLTRADCRKTAEEVSCHQDIAADGFFSLGMLADFAEPIRHYGPWFYRNLFWEAGMIGQVLYLEAEAAGARSTGIGCYFDDPVHEILGLVDSQFQDLYHFTVGVHVEDARLQSWPAYASADHLNMHPPVP
ncbi:MAG: SagB/ThcOx family dehydrogenase [Planctomycetes bacterium]|nr:SagB/ThcOx family dehydrogenase [Planctomycetota bacterium]